MATSQGQPAAEADSRRGFLAKAGAVALWVGALLAPLGAGIAAFFYPARMKGRSSDDFLRLTSLDMIPEDGTPKLVPVVADRTDAWNYYPNEPVGAVFLRRTGDGEVVAFQSVCPHAGCKIGYVEGSGEEEAQAKFFCPCHKASFDLGGVRTDAVSESPRDMDTLEVKVEDGEVLVRFQNFRTGTTEKVVES